MVEIYNHLGVSASGFNSPPFVTSWFLPTRILACIRAIISIYCFTTIFYSWSWFANHKVTYHLKDVELPSITFDMGSEAIGRSFSYFTYLSYWGLAFYFGIAGIHTFAFSRSRTSWLDYWPRPLQALHSIFYSSIVCFPFLVSAIYWGTMWAGPWFQHDFDMWSAISIHMVNSVFAAFEVFATRTLPLPWLHLVPLLLIMSLYVGVAYVTRAVEGVYVYLWLDPKVGVVQIIGHIFAYAGAISIIFTVVKSLIWLRCRLTKQQTSSSRRDFRLSCGSSQHTLWSPDEILIQKSEVKEETIEMQDLHEEDLREPEPVYDVFPRRSSSFHVRNFAQPEAATTMSPKLQGFWI